VRSTSPLRLALIPLFMFGFGFALVPLYDVFCDITGLNGKDYNAVMPNLAYLKDSEIADVVTFVMNSWGNPGGEVDSGQVAAARGGT